MGQGVGGFVYLSDDQENVSRVSPAGRAYFSDSYERIKKHSPINVTSASGGTQLESTPVGVVYLRSESGNGTMWWGGTGSDAPYSGNGYPLWGGEQSIPIRVTDFAAIQIVASISGQIVYPIGFLNGEDTTLPNIMPNLPDITAPYIISISPVSGISGVSLDSDVSVRFSETINPDSVVSGVLRLSPAHNVTIFRDNSNTTDVVLRPNVNMSGSTVYFATMVSGTVTDLNGNIAASGRGWPFTTTNAPPPPDVTAPKVSGITPVSGANNTGNTVSPTVLFSEQMLSGTINTTNIYVASTSGAAAGVAATVTLDPGDRKTVTIDPTSDLTTGLTYYINVTTGCQDLSTNALSPAVANHLFTTAYNFVEVYNVNSTADDNQIGPSQDDGAGFKINASCAMKDQIPKRVIVKVKRGSTSTNGTVFLKIYNSANTVVSTFGSFSATVLTTSAQDITITNLDNTDSLANGYQMMLTYPSGTGSVNVYRTTSNSYTGAIYADIDSSGDFNDDSGTIDISWKVYK